MIEVPLWAWIGFFAAVMAMLGLDLFVLNRKAHAPSMKEALLYSCFWIALGLGFGVVVWQWLGPQAGAEYYTAYLLEESLSVDNLFVIGALFTLFGVLPQFQHRVLFWGIIGAIVMRFAFLFAGVQILQRFDWLLVVFGAALIFTAFKLLKGEDEDQSHLSEEERKQKADEKARNNKLVQIFGRFLPFTNEPHGEYFFVRKAGKLVATPLFITLIMVESSDLMFALDSLPAALSVSQNAFVVITSNAMALLGLRSLYFVVNNIISMFRFLKYGLSFLLFFIGMKMILDVFGLFHMETLWSLIIVAVTLIASVALSLLFPKKKKQG